MEAVREKCVAREVAVDPRICRLARALTCVLSHQTLAMNVSGKRKPSSSSSKSEEDEIPRIREPEAAVAAAAGSVAPAEPEGAVGASTEPAQPVPQQLPPPSTAGMWPGARQGTRTKTSHQKKKKNVVSVDQPPEVKDEPVTGSARPRAKQRGELTARGLGRGASGLGFWSSLTGL